MRLKTLASGLIAASACWMCLAITLAICGQTFSFVLILGAACLVVGLIAAFLDEYR